MENWEPESEWLNNILSLLVQSQSANNEAHRHVQEQFNQLSSFPLFNNYLIYILVKLSEVDEATRALSGLILKSNVKTSFAAFPVEVAEYIKQLCLQHIGDPHMLVRATIGTLITTIVCIGGLQSWSDLLPTLMQQISSNEYTVVEGAFGALQKICEDSSTQLELDPSQPLNVMIPAFLQFFQNGEPSIRAHALTCINQFVMRSPPALIENMSMFVEGLYTMAVDADSTVRKNVCQALVMLVEVGVEHLMPQMDNVIQYMLHTTQDADENVALEACEFWLAVADLEECGRILANYVSALVPILLNGMRYSEHDLAMQSLDDDDAHVPDRASDIRPRFAKSRTHASGGGGGGNQEWSDGTEAGGGDDDSDDDDDGTDDGSELSHWNLRKCSAAALDVLSTIFTTELLEPLLPLLSEKLQSTSWPDKECGILALGAIAAGCSELIYPHLTNLVPFLLESLSDQRALVRSITCWTLSRYCKWVVVHSGDPAYLQELMRRLLQCILDRNKRVQEAACSAFATLEEEACVELVPFLSDILQTLVQAFELYQHKNLMILYDAIGTLADSVGGNLSLPRYIELLMPPILRNWQNLGNADPDLLPVLECLSSLAAAFGMGFLPYAPQIFTRCVQIIEGTLVAAALAEQDESQTMPEKDFMITALDLLSSISDGLECNVESLVDPQHSNLLELLYRCMQDPIPEVRQSAFALLGDITKACFSHVQLFVGNFLPILTQNVDPLSLTDPACVSVCNNASWAIGEIALNVQSGMQPYVPDLLARLIAILAGAKNKTLLENVAITTGRLSLVCPQEIAPSLGEFILPWCKSMRQIRDNTEKYDAFRGVCQLIKINPNGVMESFVFFCQAVVSWSTPPEDLKETFREILFGFRQMLDTNQWNEYFGRFPEALKRRLNQEYGL